MIGGEAGQFGLPAFPGVWKGKHEKENQMAGSGTAVAYFYINDRGNRLRIFPERRGE